MIQTLIKPHITEKSMVGANNSIFTFVVDPSSPKSTIKHAIESTFKVHVTKITTRLMHIPAKRTGSRRRLGSASRQKLASVHLKKGESIALFEFKEDLSAQAGK